MFYYGKINLNIIYGGVRVNNSGKLLSELIENYGIRLGPLNNDEDFFFELVKVSHIAIRGEETNDLFINVNLLLEYALRKEHSRLTLMLTETLLAMHLHTRIKITENAAITRQLGCVFSIQYSQHKVEIYYNVLRLMTTSTNERGIKNIKTVLGPLLHKFDANIYECFHLPLSLELLHTYLVIDRHAFSSLLSDILMDWNLYDDQIDPIMFEKLLWYAFISDNKRILKEQVTKYDSFIKADRWGIKCYRFIRQNLSKSDQLEKLRTSPVLNQLLNRSSYTSIEKEAFLNKIYAKIHEKESKLNMVQELPHKQITRSITRLSSYNLPPDVKLQDIHHKKIIHLAVFESKEMKRISKTIQVEVLTDVNEKEFYINKATLKAIKGKVGSAYIYVVDYSKEKKREKIEEEKLFKWPSTEISGVGYEEENNSTGLNEKSALRKMGYQITNMTRQKRWEILQHAVPKLGLKKVAYIIASNVKLRKGQKNGLQKFSYSISEWEYDLDKLKSRYYKKEFIWPRT